ncbi:MAG: hypothetical protein KZQ99_19105 [Candidatus Thiodiazotropha sp. (ex Dulcina madagascariensis)]|nr:hypothetical protein [Candidatus Thiodiazotropha sp. (ex Dulcina madagascariensis)]
MVGITCLASGALLNAAIGRFNGKGGDEQTLLRSIQETLTVREFKASGKVMVTTMICSRISSKADLGIPVGVLDQASNGASGLHSGH